MDMFSALGDSTRRNIIELLATSGQLSSTQISNKFNISSPAISQHLKVLREAKLVDMEKQAQKRIYKINPDTILELEKWVRQMTQRWNERFMALDAILKIEKDKMLNLRKEHTNDK